MIQITPEHPVFVEHRGWAPAGEVLAGDVLSTVNLPVANTPETAAWLTVESNRSTGEFATVYNFRVADWHTYFVGTPDWGFGLWVHNSYKDYIRSANPQLAESRFDELAAKRRDWKLPVAGSTEDVFTVAKLEVDGFEAFGRNAHGRPNVFPTSGEGGVPFSWRHAEGDVLIQAVEQGVPLSGQTVRIYTDRNLCDFCDKSAGLENMARFLGINRVIAYTPSGRIVINL